MIVTRIESRRFGGTFNEGIVTKGRLFDELESAKELDETKTKGQASLKKMTLHDQSVESLITTPPVRRNIGTLSKKKNDFCLRFAFRDQKRRRVFCRRSSPLARKLLIRCQNARRYFETNVVFSFYFSRLNKRKSRDHLASFSGCPFGGRRDARNEN